jgi:hypothetical protein
MSELCSGLRRLLSPQRILLTALGCLAVCVTLLVSPQEPLLRTETARDGGDSVLQVCKILLRGPLPENIVVIYKGETTCRLHRMTPEKLVRGKPDQWPMPRRWPLLSFANLYCFPSGTFYEDDMLPFLQRSSSYFWAKRKKKEIYACKQLFISVHCAMLYFRNIHLFPLFSVHDYFLP